jgi:hypothetical protein
VIFLNAREVIMSKNAEIKSPHREKLLAAHQYQGSSNDCGPYCVAIAVNALKNRELDGHKLGEKMNGWVWRGPLPIPRRIPNWATLPCGVTDELRQQGMRACWHRFSSQDSLLRNLASDKTQIVIIGQLKPLWGHYMLLVAYHPQDGWGFVNPAYDIKKTFWMKENKFIKQWQGLGRQVIVASP